MIVKVCCVAKISQIFPTFFSVGKFIAFFTVIPNFGTHFDTI